MEPEPSAYRLYLVGKDQSISDPIPLWDCTDDAEALEIGKAFVDGCGVEVWNRGTKLADYPSVD